MWASSRSECVAPLLRWQVGRLWAGLCLTLLEVVRPVRERHKGEILPLLRQQVTVVTLIWHQRRVGELHLVGEENKVRVGKDVVVLFCFI